MTNDAPTNVPGSSRSVPWPACAIVTGCLGLAALYLYQTRLPAEVTIAGGPRDGRYAQLAQELAGELQRRLGIIVRVPGPSRGSMDNIQALESGEVTLGLYQSETRVVLDAAAENPRSSVLFVANMYPEYLIPVAAADESLDMTQLRDRIVACNDPMSGDHAMLELLLRHLGGRQQPKTTSIPYDKLPQALADGDVDLAVISCGLEAPVLAHVLDDGNTKLVRIPFLQSFASRNPAFSRRTIPAGYFSTHPNPIPDTDFETVTTQAQLLASSDAPVRLVEAATEIILDPGFQRRLGLTDLNSGGREFAMSRPEFPMHPGASHIYHPDLKPLLNPDFVEGTEGIRSFLVSIVAAVWLAGRWWNRRKVLSQEHRLDRYIRDLLQIERDQIGVDGNEADDSAALQELLDRVTNLRQAALAEFTAHEMNEDRAVDCFVQMCHALSDKVSGKLTRHAMRYPRHP